MMNIHEYLTWKILRGGFIINHDELILSNNKGYDINLCGCLCRCPSDMNSFS